MRFAQRFFERQQLAPLAHRLGQLIADEARVLVDRALFDAAEGARRNSFDVGVDGNHAPERVVVGRARLGAGPFDVGVVHHLSAAVIALLHLAADQHLLEKIVLEPLHQIGPEVVPDAHQRSARVVAHDHFQPPTAAARFLRFHDAAGDDAAFSDGSVGHHPRRAAIFVAPRQVEQQVLDGGEAFGGELFGHGRADAAQLLDGRRQRIGGLLQGSLRLHARELSLTP